MFILPAIHFLLYATISWAQGINCNGNFWLCGAQGGRHDSRDLACYLDTLDNNYIFSDGEFLACSSYRICAFLRNTGGKSGAEIKAVAHSLEQHGCHSCGEVAFDGQDVNNGALVFAGEPNQNCIGFLCNNCRGVDCCSL